MPDRDWKAYYAKNRDVCKARSLAYYHRLSEERKYVIRVARGLKISHAEARAVIAADAARREQRHAEVHQGRDLEN